jgi:hypothetical protein
LAKGNLTSVVVSPEQKEGGLTRVKIPLFIVGVFLTLSATSQAGPRGGGFSSGGFHGGFVARSTGRPAHGGGFSGGGFRAGFDARSAGPAFRMGHSIHRDFADHRFFCHNHLIFFQQFAWPIYWYPYNDPLSYSYLEPDHDYQYWDNSAAPVQPESFRRDVDHGPIVVVINTGNSRPMDSGSNAGYVDRGYISANAGAQQRMVAQNPGEKTGSRTDPMAPAAPAVPQATPAIPRATSALAQTTQAALQPEAGVFGKLVLVSWLNDGGKDVIFVRNIETNGVQRITSKPNIDNFRIVEIHPNADPKQFEAIISNGFEQGAVRFGF